MNDLKTQEESRKVTRVIVTALLNESGSITNRSRFISYLNLEKIPKPIFFIVADSKEPTCMVHLSVDSGLKSSYFK